MSRLARMVILAALGAARVAAAEPPDLPPPAVLRQWIEDMKGAPRGPFERLRWFCNDGTVHPPKPYPCEQRGGGVQHGEWTERAAALRAAGYEIANVIAGLDPNTFAGADPDVDRLAQILVERFLIGADDGWIFRGARTYRGGLQAEDEETSSRAIALAMLGDPAWRAAPRFLLLRETIRLLPMRVENRSADDVRNLTTEIARADPAFQPLRAKIHGTPDAADASAVRSYAREHGKTELASRYEALAGAIDAAYAAGETAPMLGALAEKVSDPALASSLRAAAEHIAAAPPAERLTQAASLLADLRDALTGESNPDIALAMVGAGFALEREVYGAGNGVAAALGGVDRRHRLAIAGDAARALYGTGFLGRRELGAALDATTRLGPESVPVRDYLDELRYLARVPEWAARRLAFHFGPAIGRLATIEPLARLYPQSRLRASAALLYSRVLDSLIRDANRVAGIEHQFFGQRIGIGLRALNPGIARGVLHVAEGEVAATLDPDGIYLLPETIADLAPVSGILTRGEGSSLSHVQLLARNLGVPNVVVSESLLPQLRSEAEHKVVLAVSPAGVVQIEPDGPRWAAVFGEVSAADDLRIRPDVEKLDLSLVDLPALSTVRAVDSGRVCGPKGAKLGELKHLFGDSVPDGFVIPFGVFRKILDQPIEPGGPTVWAWMSDGYASIARAPEPERRRLADEFLARLRSWIEAADLGPDLNGRLQSALRRTFGADASYGVFVRSDTNVEDLPGFTGAGLNLTVPNVVGEEEVAHALRQVWASPFTERAYGWRQAHMEKPEYVFPGVVVQRAVPSEKSGVMVTADLERGAPGWISIAISEGVGGAVEGQSAEALRVELASGNAQLLATAAEPWRTALSPLGGVRRVRASGAEQVLAPGELTQLIAFARELPGRFPALRDEQGRPAAADVEFAFRDGRMVLLQIRPLVQNRRAQNSRYLAGLDAGMRARATERVRLDQPPEDGS